MTDSVIQVDANADLAAIQDKAELLAQLRDVHVPEVSTWPAPGWFVLVFLTLAIFIAGFIIKKRRQQYAQNAWRREALEAISELEQRLPEASDSERHALVQDASSLLRRVMMHARGRSEVAGLTADAWLDELNANTSSYTLDKTLQPLLTEVPYQTVPADLATAGNVSSLLNWIQQTIESLPNTQTLSIQNRSIKSNKKASSGTSL